MRMLLHKKRHQNHEVPPHSSLAVSSSCHLPLQGKAKRGRHFASAKVFPPEAVTVLVCPACPYDKRFIC